MTERASDDETRRGGGLLGSGFRARLSTSCHTGAVAQIRQLESENQLDLTQQMGSKGTMTVERTCGFDLLAMKQEGLM